MTVMVAVPESAEGVRALEAGIAEARRRHTDLLIVNLALGPIDISGVPDDLSYEVVERVGKADRDPASTVLQALETHPDVERLVICVARRSAVGKLVLGSISQQLILQAEVPVLAVKLAAD